MKLKRPLPKPALIGGIVAAGLLVLVVGWLLVVSPQNGKASTLAKQTADVQKQVSENLAQAAASKAAAAPPAIKVADVYKLAKAMPSSTDMPDILLELDQVARDAGVDLQSISPAPAAADPSGQQSVKITLTVSGDFFTVTDLLYRLRNLVSVRDGVLDATGRLFAIDTVALSPVGRQITASIALHTYVYGGSALSVPSTAVPTTTTSTGTTPTTTPGTSNAPSAAGAP